MLKVASQLAILLCVVTLLSCFFSYWFENNTYNTYILNDDKYQLDATAGHIKKPNLSVAFDWPEHPNKSFTVTTNNYGFREDQDTRLEKSTNTKRLIVTGDSHTDGAVNNAESFCSLLENQLNAVDTPINYEVINAAAGYCTFKNYRGCLTRNLKFSPDHFIVTIYTGNEFIEALFSDNNPSFLESCQRSCYRIRKGFHFSTSDKRGVSQGVLQNFYFDLYPSHQEKAIKIAQQEIDEMVKICAKNDIQLMFLLLPSQTEVKSESNSNALARGLKKHFDQRKVRYIELLPEFKKSRESLYWEEDLHLNLNGHKLVASTLFAELQ
ncbi:hypothetical protein N9R81_05730 [Flavobacteriales bacterium]|nr:hypothetical protein [Flavobacteriales bacterium]